MPTLIAAHGSRSGCSPISPRLHEPSERVVQREVTAADRRGAGSAVGLQHVAVDDDLPLAERDHVAHGAQRPADQSLDLLRATRRTALLHLASNPFGRRPGKHRVLRRDPSLAAAAHPAGDVLVDRRGAQHPRATERHEDRARGRLGEVAFERDRSQLVGLPAVDSHVWVLIARSSGGATATSTSSPNASAACTAGAVAVEAGREMGDHEPACARITRGCRRPLVRSGG